MYLILNIGMTGEGKTTWTKNFIKGKNCLVFDINNEYQDLPTDWKQKRGRFIGIHEDFIQICQIRKNTNLVFEEATGFLQGGISKDLQKLIIAKRHQKNNLIFIFHSINRVPPALFEMCNYVVLHKTADIEKQVEKKNPKLISAFRKLQRSPQYSEIIVKNV
jgi:hypothetical protein